MEKGNGENCLVRMCVYEKPCIQGEGETEKIGMGKPLIKVHPLRRISVFRFAFWVLTVKRKTT
jgi:hypothetical protein